MASDFSPAIRARPRAYLLGRRVGRSLAAGVLITAMLVSGCKNQEKRAVAFEAKADELAALSAWPPAVQYMRMATDASGDDPQLWLKLGRLQLRADDPTGASVSFQRAVDLAPDNVEALENVAVLSVRGGDFDGAKKVVESLLLLQPNDPAGLMAQGAIAIQERRYADALVSADKAIAGAPDFSEVYLLRARALAKVGRAREAIALLEKRSAQDPQNSSLLLLLLNDYQQVGDAGGIRAAALRLHAIFPDEPSYALEAARAYRAQGRDADARAALVDIMQRHPNDASVIHGVANYWIDTLPADGARAELASMAAAGSQVVKVVVANRLIDIGALDDALTLLAPAATGRLTPRTVDAATGYARALLVAGRVREARALIDRVLRFDGTNIAALIVRTRAEMAAGDFATALTDAQLAASNDPTNETAGLLVAQVYAAAGNAVLAQQAFALAVQQWPDSFDVIRPYLAWLDANGRSDEAISVLGSFARRHRSHGEAWRRYAQACVAAHAICADEARMGAAALGIRVAA